VQRKSLWRFYVSKRNSAVNFSQIEPKLSYLAIGKAQLNAWAFSDGLKKQKCCPLTRRYKNCYKFSLQFFDLKLGRMLCNSYSNCFCDFYIFPIVGIGAINFLSQKTANPPLFYGVFSLQKKWKSSLISIFVKYTMWMIFLCRICVSIMHGFQSRVFLKQRLTQSSVSAKTILAF